MMVELEIPDNGRTLKKDDPVRAAILARRAEYRARGEKYPEQVLDDFYQIPFVWFGHVAYNETTLDHITQAGRSSLRPIALPDHYMLDGESKLPGERVDQYEKYLVFRDLGAESRTLAKVARSTLPDSDHRRYDRIMRMAARFRWEERARAYDSHMEIEARRAAQAVLQEQMQVEVARRATYLANEWLVIEKGFEVVKEMLKYPVVVQKYISPDGKTTIWEPGKWTYAAMSQLIDTLAKYGRLHTGLSTSNTASKIESTIRDGSDKPAMTGEEEEMHLYASQKAEDAYFNACEEWKARKSAPDRITISQAAD